MGKGAVMDIDRGWKRIVKEFGAAKGAHVAVGVLSDAGAYEDEGHANLADVATWNEFGTHTIPERPFMKQSYDKNEREVRAFIAESYSRFLEGKLTLAQALDQIGVFFTGKVKEQFTEGDFAPNAPSTIRAFIQKSSSGRARLEGAIRKANSEGNAASASKLKEFLKSASSKRPLIDTGRLRQAINYEVRLK